MFILYKMGNNPSSVSNAGTESVKLSTSTTNTFFAPSSKIINAGTEVEQITATITRVLNFHTKLHEVFDKLLPIIPSFEYKLSTGRPVQAILNESLNDDAPSKETGIVFITFLFNLGVLKTILKSNDSMSVVVHQNFKPIHSKLLANLQKLSVIAPIESEFSMDTVSDQTIKAQFDNNMKTMNHIMARIIFYKYCIVFNNYLNHVYAIYAQSQIEIFDAQIKKQKKQNEFVIIQKALQEALEGTNTRYDTKLNTSLNALNKKLANVTSGGANATMPQNTRVVSNIKNVQSLLLKSFREFEQSNQQTEEFFAKVNNIIEAKTASIVSKYKDMNMSEILNKNIIKALGNLEKKIRDHTITPSSDNIEMILSNLTSGEQEKNLLRGYLQMVSIQANAEHLNDTLKDTITVTASVVDPEIITNTKTKNTSTITTTINTINTTKPNTRPMEVNTTNTAAPNPVVSYTNTTTTTNGKKPNARSVGVNASATTNVKKPNAIS